MSTVVFAVASVFRMSMIGLIARCIISGGTSAPFMASGES